MKKLLLLALAVCLIFASCSEIENAVKTTNNLGQSIQNEEELQNGAAGKNVKIDAPKISYTGDASVEVLVQLGKDFLFAAFGNDTDNMSNLCSETFSEKIRKNPKLFIGTKPDYDIDNIDMSIKPFKDAGKYSLLADVSAVKKDNKKKYLYKYSFDINKVDGDYFITDFKRIY